jgi:hypothetical protein
VTKKFVGVFVRFRAPLHQQVHHLSEYNNRALGRENHKMMVVSKQKPLKNMLISYLIHHCDSLLAIVWCLKKLDCFNLPFFIVK